MIARNTSSRANSALRALALAALSASTIFGCSAIIGLDGYSVAKQATNTEAGAGGEGNNGDAGAGNTGNAPSVVGCDGKTGFTPNEAIITSCLMRAGCDPSFNPVRTISTCVTKNTQKALPGEACNLDSTSCADYEKCDHVGVAHDDLCGGDKKTRCQGDIAVNCGNYASGDRFFDCAALGGTCAKFHYVNPDINVDNDYADCVMPVDAGSCTDPGTNTPISDDSKYYCQSGGGQTDDLRYYCWDGIAYGATCTSLAKCKDDASSVTVGDGGVEPSKQGGDATCYFNLTKCGSDSITCDGDTANDCSGGSLFKYGCGSVGLSCDITSGTEYCLAPGCKAADVDTNCTESCSDDGKQLTFCYGGAPYTVTCSDYGFTQCLSDTNDSGPFAACRF